MINIFQPVGSSPTTTEGDLIVRGASSDGRLAIGANATVLTSNGTTATWAAAAGGGLTIGTTTITSGTSTRLLFDAAGVVSETDGATWDATNKALTVGGATVTTSNPVLNLSQTWNAGAVTFTGLKLNVTNTASASDSLLMDLNVGGGSVFSVMRNGRIKLGSAAIAYNAGTNGDLGYYYSASDASPRARFGTDGVFITSQNAYAWTDNSANSQDTADLFLSRRAAAWLTIGRYDVPAPVAQTLGVQSVIAGTSNTAGVNWTLAGSLGTGTGAGGSIIFKTAPAGSSGSSQNALAAVLTLDSTKQADFSGHMQMTEITAPSAGAANTVRLYAQDNGAGKTQLMALFASGAAQQVAIEP